MSFERTQCILHQISPGSFPIRKQPAKGNLLVRERPKKQPDVLFEEALSYLKAGGFRLTKPRELIVRAAVAFAGPFHAEDLLAKARQLDELAAEVAGASREQTQGITQISTAVGQMDRVTQGNAASAEESAAAAQELETQARSMKDAVERLQQLVGRQASAGDHSPKPKIHSNGHVAKPGATHHGYAKGHANAPATNGNGNGKAPHDEIPLEAGFRDF